MNIVKKKSPVFIQKMECFVVMFVGQIFKEKRREGMIEMCTQYICGCTVPCDDEMKDYGCRGIEESQLPCSDCSKLALKEEIIETIKKMEYDYSDNSNKPLLKPQNNREYWLFTEERQRWMDKFNLTEEDLK